VGFLQFTLAISTMAKQKTSVLASIIALLILLCLAGAVIGLIQEYFQVILVVGVLLAGASIGVWALVKWTQRKGLLQKYGDPTIAERIQQKLIWEGQTAEQLRDSQGAPEAIEEAYLKHVQRQVWKYGRTGKNRFRLRVTLENGCVVGWEKKD
jgi:hypothetical protein